MMSALEEFRRRRGVKEKAGMGEGSNDEWGTAGKDWEWDDGTDEEAEKKEEKEKQEQEEKERKRLKEKAEAEERRLKEEEEERARRAAEEEAMLEAARVAKEAEAAALRDTLGDDDRVKFDEMVGRGMLLNQIMLYFMTGGTEEEVKEEIKRKIKCGVEIEEVGKEEPQTLVIESASSAVDTSEVEIVSRQGVEPEPEEETPGLECISQDENADTRNLNNSEHENTAEVFEKENNNMFEQTDENVATEEKADRDNLTTDNNVVVNLTAEEVNLPRGEEETRKDFGREEQTAVSDDSSAEVRQPDLLCNFAENAEDLEQQDCNESENNSKQIAEIAKAEVEEVADEVNDDQSVMSYLDEDETLIQDVEKSDMVEEAQPWAAGGTGVKAPGGDVDQVRMTSTRVTEDPGQGEGLSQQRTDEAGGNLNDTRENADGYVSIVDRMLGMSAKPSQKYEDPKEASGKRDQKQEKNDVSIIVETIKSATNQTESNEVEVELSPQQVGLKVAMDRVLREKSAAKEMSVPRELASQLLSLSSANVSAELKRSCSNIVARSMGQDENSEKKYLLSRLEELLRLEKQQVNADLKARRKQLGETRVGQKDEFDGLQRKHQEEVALMRLRQQEERRRVEAHFLDKADHLRKEVELLENEMESMNSPSQLANLALDPSLLSFTCSTPTLSTSSLMAGPQTSELEAELQCCGCLKVCQPPTKIYQCSEGDLLCSSCLPPTLATCPACGMHLQGRTSRNKALEKLALKLIC